MSPYSALAMKFMAWWGGVGGLQGTLAEFIAVDTDLLAHKPTNLSMRRAAALPLGAITAWEALVDRAHVCADQTVQAGPTRGDGFWTAQGTLHGGNHRCMGAHGGR